MQYQHKRKTIKKNEAGMFVQGFQSSSRKSWQGGM